METDLLLQNMEGNFQSLRSMWNTKVQEEQKLLKPKTVIYRSQSELVQKASSSTKNERRSIMIADETVSHKKELTVTFDDQKISDLKSIEKLSSVDESEDTIPLLPPPPPSIVFKGQAQSISIMKQSVSKMFNFDKKKTHFNNLKTNGIRHWHIARHVFRSGLIFSPTRRASDSILPLLIRTHIAQYQSRTASLDSIFTPTPLEDLIDYLTYDNDNKQMNIPEKKVPVKRMISDTGACIERNKLNDTIAQYEVLMRHLKNYDKFMATYPVPPSSSSPKRKSIDTEDIRNKNGGGDDGDNIQQISTATSSIRSRQTQSLARNVGRTFTDFIMNDLLLLPVSKTSSDEPRRLSTIHAASQTDLIELIPKEEEEEIKQVVDEINTIIKNIEDEEEGKEKGKEAEVEEEEEEKPEEVPLTANSEINVIIVNSSEMQVAEQEVAVKIQQNGEKSLIQRLFEGKKTAYTPDDIQMETTRIPEELMNTFEIAKRKCFFNTERVLYATKMIKIDRRGYKQHVRIFCITTERLYIITKKDPYPKEAVLFKDVLGISCTPRNDGFICLHTRETREDRGDWIFLVDHPCECITQIFMALGRNDNNDHYLKIKTEFKHTRRSLATVPDDCSIASRSADTFHIEFENYEVLAIYSP